MMRGSSSRFALFRDVMGAEWEQRLTVYMIDMVGGDGPDPVANWATLRLTRLECLDGSPPLMRQRIRIPRQSFAESNASGGDGWHRAQDGVLRRFALVQHASRAGR